MIYFCCNQKRREAVGKHLLLNGIDRLEVVDREYAGTAQSALRQRELRIFFVKSPDATLHPAILSADRNSVRITGGDTGSAIEIESASWLASGGYLRVRLKNYGDYSTYTLHLVANGQDVIPPFDPMPGLDARLSQIDFNFKVECPSDFDCMENCACPPEVPEVPELDYLAKDYLSFRRLMLDRMSLIAPDWKERNTADLGITLVELLAYAGDYLSYRQDAVATEAYPGTARERISMRRHARLLDYRMHEGCSARTWVRLEVNAANCPAGGVLLKRFSPLSDGGRSLQAQTCFAVREASGPVLASTAEELDAILKAEEPVIFEPLHDALLHPSVNEVPFYTWSDSECCLPAGAVKATLAGALPRLVPGMVIVLAEVKGPATGHTGDADPSRRHAVRLTAVNGLSPEDFLKGRTVPGRTDALTGAAVTDIAWSDEDALPFPLCLSTEHHSAVSVAWGNVLLCDHGATLPAADDLGAAVAAPAYLKPVHAGCGQCGESAPASAISRFRPVMLRDGLTHAVPVTAALHPWLAPDLPAARALQHDTGESIRSALPALLLHNAGGTWEPQHDLIASASTARDFVAETANNGRAVLRFGDGANGMEPVAGEAFTARMRRGCGVSGNAGADAVSQIYTPAFYDFTGQTALTLTARDLITAVRNPLPARGGTAPETLEEVRQYAPQAYRAQRRCVTPEDYAQRAAQMPGVQRAAASLRWTGSWYTIFLTVDRTGRLPVDADFEQSLRDFLEPWRMAGHDLEINAPQFVPLEIKLSICVQPGYFRSDVKRALTDVFSARRRPDGSTGFFHPDRLTFGDAVHLSAVLAEAQKVDGVQHAGALLFRRLGDTSTAIPVSLGTGRLEIPRLESNPSRPGHGIIQFAMKGGR